MGYYTFFDAAPSQPAGAVQVHLLSGEEVEVDVYDTDSMDDFRARVAESLQMPYPELLRLTSGSRNLKSTDRVEDIRSMNVIVTIDSDFTDAELERAFNLCASVDLKPHTWQALSVNSRLRIFRFCKNLAKLGVDIPIDALGSVVRQGMTAYPSCLGFTIQPDMAPKSYVEFEPDPQWSQQVIRLCDFRTMLRDDALYDARLALVDVIRRSNAPYVIT